MVEMTARDLDYFTNVVDKTVEGFERTDSNVEGISTVAKNTNQTALPTTEKPCVKGRVGQCGKLGCCPRKSPEPPDLQQPPP